MDGVTLVEPDLIDAEVAPPGPTAAHMLDHEPLGQPADEG
jgi:hypothetical protein